MSYDKYRELQHQSLAWFKTELTKRVQAAFIFPIAEVEEAWGNQWGINKGEDEPLTPEEQAAEDVFELWRKKVLDNGHHQLRLLIKEIERIWDAKGLDR